MVMVVAIEAVVINVVVDDSIGVVGVLLVVVIIFGYTFMSSPTTPLYTTPLASPLINLTEV